MNKDTIPYVQHARNDKTHHKRLDTYDKLTLKIRYYNWLPTIQSDYCEERQAEEFSYAIDRKVTRRQVMRMKAELWEDGDIEIVLLPNGKRRNSKHKIVKLSGDKIKPIDLMMKHRKFHRLGEWADLGHEDLIDCYFRSHLNIVPCRNKRPIFSRRDWQKKTRPKKKEYLLDSKYQIGLWISNFDPTIFDFDCETEKRFPTLTVKSPHGYHFHFERQAGIFNSVKKVSPVIDTRAKGGLIIIPPTPNYQWINLTNPAPVPADLLAMWKTRSRDEWKDCYVGPTTKSSGNVNVHLQLDDAKGRNDYLFHYGRSLRNSGVGFEQIGSRLVAINRSFPTPLPERELRYLVRHICTYKDSDDYLKKMLAAPKS